VPPSPLKEQACLGVSTYAVASVTFQSDISNIRRSEQATFAATWPPDTASSNERIVSAQSLTGRQPQTCPDGVR
jgi:hypothetical protein